MVLGCLGSTSARAEEPAATRAAIVVTDRVNVSSGEERLLVVAMARGIEAETTATFLSPEDVAAKLADGVPADCLNSTSCVRGLISALGVDDILAVALVRVGTSYQVDTTFVDISDGGLTPRPTVQVDADAGDHAAVFRRHAVEFLPHRVKPKVLDSWDKGVEGPLGPEGSAAAAQPRGRHFTTGVWIAAGVGAAALTTGLVLGWSARHDTKDCRYQRPITDFCSESDVDSIERRLLLADVALGSALGAAVVAGVLYWFSADDEIKVMPTASAGSSGLAVFGTF